MAQPPDFGRCQLTLVIDIKRVFLTATALQIGAQCVVSCGGNGIELVIVAPRTCDRQAKKRLAEKVNLVIHDVRFIAQHIGGCVRCFVQVPESCSDDGFVPTVFWIPPRFGQQVTGNVFANELIKGHISIECTNQVIAVFMSVSQRIIEFVPIGFSVTNKIHPMPRPLFAQLWRSEQVIYHTLMSSIAIIVQEIGDLLRGWRQTCQIKADTPQPDSFTGIRGGLQTSSFYFAENEPVHFRIRPLFVFNPRRIRMGDWTPTPMRVVTLLEINTLVFRFGCTLGSPRIGRPHFNPLFKNINFAGSQL